VEDIRNSIVPATTSFAQPRQAHGNVSLTTFSVAQQRHCLNNVLAAKAGIQEKQPCMAKQSQEMGKNLEDTMDRAGRCRVESTARSALGRLVTGFPPSRE